MKTEIEQGQKLKDGDYFEGGTVEQYNDLLYIENDTTTARITASLIESITAYLDDGNKEYLNHGCAESNKTEYSFEAFRQLCENTFGDVWDNFDNKNLGERLTKW
jgi:hypothetical protein